MFKELVAKKRYSFHEGFDDWRDAVRAACQPLLDDGTITPIYPDEIIKKVEELGPYIVIAPNICIPHAQEGVGVNDTAMCFMKTEKPVHFDPNDPEKDARILFLHQQIIIFISKISAHCPKRFQMKMLLQKF